MNKALFHAVLLGAVGTFLGNIAYTAYVTRKTGA